MIRNLASCCYSDLKLLSRKRTPIVVVGGVKDSDFWEVLTRELQFLSRQHEGLETHRCKDEASWWNRPLPKSRSYFMSVKHTRDNRPKDSQSPGKVLGSNINNTTKNRP